MFLRWCCNIMVLKITDSMINEPAVGVGLAVDVVDGVEGVFEALVDADAVALGLGAAVVGNQRLVHLRLLVDFAQLVLLQRLLTAVAPLLLLRLAHQTHPVRLLVLTVYGIVVLAGWLRDRLLPRPRHQFVRALVDADGALLPHLERSAQLVGGRVELPELCPLGRVFLLGKLPPA